ncbi:MAG: sialate O-acetylesterase [Cyclobacteriaceae bacterium]
MNFQPSLKQLFFICFIFFIAIYNPLFADVKLPYVLSSNMVLQRNQPINVWGWAAPREKVQVDFNGQKASATANKDGQWKITLKPMNHGGPYNMRIKGKNTIELKDILIGDVWVASGQSNMEWRLANTNNADEAIAQANYDKIRLFTVDKKASVKPLDNTSPASWEKCTPDNIKDFSAVAYYFGKSLHTELDVPIGLLHTSWGGTNVETWMTAEKLAEIEGLKSVVDELKKNATGNIRENHKQKMMNMLGELPEKDAGLVNGIAHWAKPGFDYSSWKTMQIPGLWEERELEDLDGVVWFMTEFELSDEESKSKLTLSLGPIDDSDITWVNGQKVGETNNEYSALREYTVAPEHLKSGRNTLVVRVEDFGGGGGLYGTNEQLYIKSTTKYISLVGNWKYKVAKVILQNELKPNELPALLFNAMIHPILPYSIKGAIWYQGESNAGRAYQYRKSFPMMIEDWRKHWGIGDFPFYFVQLANFKKPTESPGDSDWAELREAQTMTLSLPNTDMAVTIDIGEADDIHPRNKLDVGERLAKAALHKTYGKDLVHSGPMYKSMKIEGNSLRIAFDHVGSGLEIKDRYGYLKGFAVAGVDRKFHWAKAKIEGDEVVVYSENVLEPVAVRYGWADNPDDVNLYNKEGLPASPFRSDNWPGITEKTSYR